jgi:hypothetical protein
MQRLRGEVVRDADAVRDDVRACVVRPPRAPRSVLIGDETGFIRKGRALAGMRRHLLGVPLAGQ